MNNDQLAISIKSLNVIAYFDMLILQFALIFEKELGRGHSLASAIISPGKKVAEDISKTRMIPKGTEALSPAPIIIEVMKNIFIKFLPTHLSPSGRICAH